MEKLNGIRRKLTLMRAKQDFELGKISRAKYNEILDSCSHPTVAAPSASKDAVPASNHIEEQPEKVLNLDEAYLQSLHQERAEVLQKKAALSNSLRHVPRDKSAKHLTDEILRLRDEFSRIQETIRQYKGTGLKPDELKKNAIAESIPSDKYTLDKDIKATKKRIKYAEDALRTAKDPGIRMRHEINAAQDKMRLEMLENKFRHED